MPVHQTFDDRRLVGTHCVVESPVRFIEDQVDRQLIICDGVRDRLPDGPALHVRRSIRAHTWQSVSELVRIVAARQERNFFESFAVLRK